MLEPNHEIDYKRVRIDSDYRKAVLELLVRQYRDDIVNYCIGFFGEGVGEDVAQEVFISVFDSLHKFRGESQIRTWIFGIARNKCLQMLRNYSRRRALIHQYREWIVRFVHRDQTTELEDIYGVKQQEENLKEALTQLNEYDRLLFNLRYDLELSIEDIARHTGKSQLSIRQHLLRIRNHIREIIENGMDQ